MNARQASQIRHGIKYARDVQVLFATFGPQAQLETLRQFKPKDKLERRAYEMTYRGAAYRRAERLVRGKARRVYLRRHGLSARCVNGAAREHPVLIPRLPCVE